MHGVAERSSLRVDPFGWEKLGELVSAELDRPVAFVEEQVVLPTEKNSVFEAGGSAADPVHDMVGVAP